MHELNGSKPLESIQSIGQVNFVRMLLYTEMLVCMRRPRSPNGAVKNQELFTLDPG
jgi:hypothetical protein